ncbi:MAG: flagellar protein export ATPase FliI [Gammaproteobacteria bacterium]|nr:flagellar protein export ATPase FliI [Gammaproteobacteria bacterium]
MPEAARAGIWSEQLDRMRGRIEPAPRLVVEGRLTRMVGLTLEAAGCTAAIGDRCRVLGPSGTRVDAEVVGFAGDKLFLMPTDAPRGLAPNARVVPLGAAGDVPVSWSLLGRVIDGAGKPLDGGGPIHADNHMPLQGRTNNPLAREPISEPLDVGVRAINALLTVGRGQRIGLVACSGVGKSVLLGMMARYTTADVIVVGLIGERGREVKEFIEQILGPQGLRRAVVVATPADTPPLLRMHGAALATTIAEYFRDQGKHVLLLMDSLTRYAQAQREIGLTIGEPPATRGYPPSVFARLPQLVERAGMGLHGIGSITGFYTVLMDVDEQNDPIADAAKAILDGHIVLSRAIADSGRYPAIDVESSISRTMPQTTTTAHRDLARQFRQHYSTYEQNRDLFNVGAYQAGSDPALDLAVRLYPQLVRFLRQDMTEGVGLQDSLRQLQTLLGAGTAGQERAGRPS